MMAYLEMVSNEDATENIAYVEHEVCCPFCESNNFLSIEVCEDGSYYRCGLCREEWSVVVE